MKKSIRYKLFIATNALVIFFVLFFWLLNTQFLEEYYMSEKKDKLIKNSNKINEIYTGNPGDIALDLEMFENATGANILIVNNKGKPKYSTFARIINENRFVQGEFHKESGKDIPGKNQEVYPNDLEDSSKNQQTYFQIQKDTELKIDFLTMVTILKTGDFLIVRTSMPAIAENASIANRFMMFTGIIVIILGSIWSYLFARKFTSPILELNKITENMAKLNFSETSNIKSEDEIGELSKNINFLSHKLDNTISELNERNQNLMEDIERERKIDEMRKEFVSNVSHELKTPIALIQGYAEGLKSNVIEDEESKEFYCDVIMNESARMNQLVKDLLNLSQIESGYYEIEKNVFDISSMITSVLNKFTTVFAQKEVSLQVLKSENILVYADMVRIEQVIINYINNAVNHVDDKKIISVEVKSMGDKIRAFVYNSGKHIPEESLDKIWTSFYKVDKARTRSYGGSGLGLSIVKGIQELHQSDYGVINEEDGVTFWFDVEKAKEDKFI